MNMQRYHARGSRAQGARTKTQARYAAYLAALKLAGEIADYWEEPHNVKLADGAFTKVDFLVQQTDGLLEYHEVKGSKGVIEEKAILKAKVIASTYPMRMLMVWPRRGGGWEYRDFTAEINVKLS